MAIDDGGYGGRRPDSPAENVPVVHESRVERGIEAGWIEERRRDRRSSPSVPDWRFKGVVGAAARQPREEPKRDDMSDHLEKMIDILEKSFAHLNERLTAVEDRSRRDVGDDVTGLPRRDTKVGRRAESPGLSPIGSFRKLPPVRGRSHCMGGAGGNSRAVEPMQTSGNDQDDRGASGIREGMSRQQKYHEQKGAQKNDADHELGGDPAVRDDRRSQFYRAASGAGRVPVGGAHANRNRARVENEKHRADRPSDGPQEASTSRSC